MTRRRSLTEQDRAVWRGFIGSVKPLRPGTNAPEPPALPAAQASTTAPPRPQARQQTAKPLPLAPLEPRLKRRVARGRDAIDARLDLHGMTQHEAHAALLRFLHRAQATDARTVLVVTGKGLAADGQGASPRGVLRRQVPLWLALPEFRNLIVGFDAAHRSHGGDGALYIRLRRSRG